jgi:hypothetical protein
VNGDAIKELADRFRGPAVLGRFLARPADWVIEDMGVLAKAPMCAPIQVSTLSAVVDYLAANRDQLDLTTAQVHVVSPAVVQVLGPLHPTTRGREVLLVATALDVASGWIGRYWPLDEFLIGLRTRFAGLQDQQMILSLLSNVKHETVRAALDDGLTQVVQARSGVALVTDVAVPRQVALSPYRTFRDLSLQPPSVFILRLQSGKAGGLPEAALYEADGGAWRLDAIEAVHEFLATADGFPEHVAVLA